MDDFPAAHSMDTAWFAVDRDGHVACFTTGEAGAVPEQGLGGEGVYPVIEQLGQLLPHGEARHHLPGRIAPGQGQGVLHPFGQGAGVLPQALLFLDSLDPVRDEIASGRVREVPTTGGPAVVTANLDEALARRLHEGGHCRGCFYYFGDEDEEDHRMARLGIDEYDHLTENWISGPYGLACVPATPVHIDQLPPAIRDQMKGMTFADLRFAETPHIQPVEHVPCVSWEGAYLDVTGSKVRPIPGQEDEYAENYENHYADLADEYDIEPPDAE